MNKQEFIDEIAKRGAIDLDKVPTGSKDYAWFRGSEPYSLTYRERRGVSGNKFIQIKHLATKNPPTSIGNINFYQWLGGASGSWTIKSSLPDDWLLARINELPFVESAHHDTALTIDITDAEGNPITTADHGDTIYITGELRDITDNVLLKNGTVELLVNGNPTGLTDITNADGIYSIPYTIYETTKFKTKFGGA